MNSLRWMLNLVLVGASLMTAQPPSPSSWWDPGRFVKTLSYFGAIPFLSDLDWFQQLIGSRVNLSVQSPAEMPTGIVLLVGGTDSLQHALMTTLVEQGYTVQSSQVWTQEPLRAVICCSTLDDPITVERLEEWRSHLHTSGQILFDFSQSSPKLQEVWGALDDVVMGGISESRLDFATGAAVFTGNVSTANSGGFASVRTRNFEPPLNLNNATGLELQIKGDGKRYKLLLRSESAWDGVAYAYSFDTTADTEMTVRIPFAEMVPVFRARTTQAKPMDPNRVYALQIMLSKFEYDGALNPHFSPGEFRLQIASIKTYGDLGLPQVVGLSTHPDAETPIRASGIPYTILRYGELTESGGDSLQVQWDGVPAGTVGIQDLAEVAARSLTQPALVGRAIALSKASTPTNTINTHVCPPQDWNCIFTHPPSNS